MLDLTWVGNFHHTTKISAVINHCVLDSETSLNTKAKLRFSDSFSPVRGSYYSSQNPLSAKVPCPKRCPVHTNCSRGTAYLLEITFRCSSWRSKVARAQRPPYTATLLGDNSWRERELSLATAMAQRRNSVICPRSSQWQDWSLSDAAEPLSVLSGIHPEPEEQLPTAKRAETHSNNQAFDWATQIHQSHSNCCLV